jgi:RNA polymerase sigma factor (sigma-70 family)
VAKPSDAELIAQHLRGDRQAFAAIYERYADPVYSLCRSILHSEDEAADAFQDTFLTATQKLHQLREPDRLKSWLYSIARNQCRARIRGQKRTVLVGDTVTAGGAKSSEVSVLDPGFEVDMTQSVVRDELRDLIAQAQAGLNERDQEILQLHLRHGLNGRLGYCW